VFGLPGFHIFRFPCCTADFASLGIKHMTLFQVGDPVGLLLVFFSFVIFGVGGGGGELAWWVAAGGWTKGTFWLDLNPVSRSSMDDCSPSSIPFMVACRVMPLGGWGRGDSVSGIH
jgi:hypothetical protein